MKKILLLLTLTLSLQAAQAGYLVEPYLGYRLGSFEDNNSNDKGDTNGYTLGARAGYSHLGLGFGLQYEIGDTTLDFDEGADTDWDNNNFGIFASYELPIMLRVFATYFLSYNLTSDINNNVKGKGDGLALGVGFTTLPLLSINLEYRMINLDEEEISGFTSDIDFSVNELLLSVSVPLNIF